MELLNEIINNPEIEEKFKEAYRHVIANMEDETTKATAKRKISIEVIFSQDVGRICVDIDTAIKETLAPKVFKVKIMAEERQIEGQMSITDYEDEYEQAKEELRKHGVDPETGEIIN